VLTSEPDLMERARKDAMAMLAAGGEHGPGPRALAAARAYGFWMQEDGATGL